MDYDVNFGFYLFDGTFKTNVIKVRKCESEDHAMEKIYNKVWQENKHAEVIVIYSTTPSVNMDEVLYRFKELIYR
jgi:hypothetical protein